MQKKTARRVHLNRETLLALDGHHLVPVAAQASLPGPCETVNVTACITNCYACVSVPCGP